MIAPKIPEKIRTPKITEINSRERCHDEKKKILDFSPYPG